MVCVVLEILGFAFKKMLFSKYHRAVLVVSSQPAAKCHIKECSRSCVDSPRARTLVFAAFESFSSCEFRASIARTPFCAILWRSPIQCEKIIECFRGRHRGGRNFTSFLQFSGPFVHAAK